MSANSFADISEAHRQIAREYTSLSQARGELGKVFDAYNALKEPEAGKDRATFDETRKLCEAESEYLHLAIQHSQEVLGILSFVKKRQQLEHGHDVLLAKQIRTVRNVRENALKLAALYGLLLDGEITKEDFGGQIKSRIDALEFAGQQDMGTARIASCPPEPFIAGSNAAVINRSIANEYERFSKLHYMLATTYETLPHARAEAKKLLEGEAKYCLIAIEQSNEIVDIMLGRLQGRYDNESREYLEGVSERGNLAELPIKAAVNLAELHMQFRNNQMDEREFGKKKLIFEKQYKEVMAIKDTFANVRIHKAGKGIQL